MRLRRGGICIPMSQTLGWGRVATLAWLCEEAACNVASAPGLVLLGSKEVEEGRN